MTSDDEAVREWAARLFRSDDDPAVAPEPAPPVDLTAGNVAPGEGGNPTTDAGDIGLHEFTAALFGRTD